LPTRPPGSCSDTSSSTSTTTGSNSSATASTSVPFGTRSAPVSCVKESKERRISVTASGSTGSCSDFWKKILKIVNPNPR